MTDTTTPTSDPTPTQFQPGPPPMGPPPINRSSGPNSQHYLPIALGAILTVAALILAVMVFRGDDTGAAAVEAASTDPSSQGLERTARAAVESVLDGDVDGALASYAPACLAGVDRALLETELGQGLAFLSAFSGVAVEDIGVGDVTIADFVEGERGQVGITFAGPAGPLFPDDEADLTQWEYTADGWRQTTCDL